MFFTWNFELITWNLFIGMFDTHCHINLIGEVPEERDAIVRSAVEAGISLLINVGVDAKTSLESRDLAEKFPEVYFAAGFHPEILNEDRHFTYDPGILDGLVKHPKFLAIGEIGLDYFHNKENKSVQIGLFRNQLEYAVSKDIPVILHTRDSWDDTLAILEDYRGKGLKGIFHCFSGDYGTAVKCLDLGFVISFAGTLTYKKAAALRDAAVRLPLDRILLETDSPFLAPVPRRGEPNRPAYVVHLYEYFSKLRNVPIPELGAIHAGILEKMGMMR